MTESEEELETRRRHAREWCEFATAGDRGRTLSDPAYQAIVEGRDKGPRYSSCGDLAHWLLYRLGCREPFLNRKEHDNYVAGRNVNRLVRRPIGSNPFAKSLEDPNELATGDIVITWTKPDTSDSHVLVFDRIEDGVVHSWDAGQGPMAEEHWAGGKDHVEIRRRQRPVGSFPIESVLQLADLPFTAATDLPSGERFDALEGRV